MTDSLEQRAIRSPSLADAIIPLVALTVLIGSSIALFGLDALDGPIQVALVMCCAVAALIALKNGHRWSAVQEAGQGALSSITSALFILLAVGALIGTWNLSGTIPTLVYYGIQVLSPGYFYVATAIICGGVAMSIGSSWTTAGTVGVGLVGIATMLGVSPAITAGAVISGAYLGDKLSPLSETTILTAQMVKVDLYTHIRSQAWTSVPAFVIAAVVFTILGVAGPPPLDTVGEEVELAKLSQIFSITPLNLLPLAVLVILSARKAPASLALLAASLWAGAQAVVLQHDVVEGFVREIHGSTNVVIGSIQAVWRAMANGFTINSGIGEIDRLLSRGGMDSMLLTIWLIIGAVTFGALLEQFGLIDRLVNPMIAAAKSTGRLYLSVFATGIGLNIVAGDQYIALVLPSRVFRLEFEKRGLAPQNLSRLAADSGTVTSALVPWNSCGAFMSAVLGVSTLAYLPFAVFNIVSPLLSVVYGYTGFKLVKASPTKEAEAT
ncbi:sodium:proton antiporter [Mycolicibacterium novocastrense]|uniref:Na+/H+ antiporter NhaC n=1 Tax=Mycolicibacterium novocastrense TaxID=59813 RepID=UPI0007474264|nr:Na+/H+ antiporter NhaC [Mycolicibacterium novocastrense]KUH67952.1 sodium:proton antiporter [Mycolicibacterium novocastrense]KUH68425.1 sodium:proton antiporter [Mycolicibacterium novocastrense]KUH73505.1 sodium:proton antiporter [Mycolicibacterium novocastrense]